VSGGGSGLGLAIAAAFHQQGALVHVADGSAEAVAQALVDHSGMHGSVADVADPADVEQFVGEAVEWMGGVDVLVNCEMSNGPRAAVEDVSPEDWTATLEAGLSGAFYCIRRVVPQMKQQVSGCILNLASSAGRTGRPLCAPLVATAAGILGLTRSLARELGPYNIRCNAIVPGLIRRRGARAGVTFPEAPPGDLDEERLDFVSMRTVVDAGEVAETVIFLASDAARHITGQTLGVCGNVEWEP
jgi:NAD(P)-dependent dehydrogenase (short-subunit alcohol dehydrogenase family)